MAWVAVTGYEAAKVLAYVKANDRVPEGYNVKYDRDPVVQKLDTVTGFDFEDPEAEFAIDNGPGPNSVTRGALAADVAAAVDTVPILQGRYELVAYDEFARYPNGPLAHT